MRVLFTAFPSVGHLHPMVPLATAFRRRGHDVRLATGENLASWARDCGLEVVTAGLTEQAAVAEASAQVPRGGQIGPYMFANVAPRPMLDDLVSLARAWPPDLIVHEEGEYAAPALARRLGVPCVTHSWNSPCRATTTRREAAARVRSLWPPASQRDASITGDISWTLARGRSSRLTSPTSRACCRSVPCRSTVPPGRRRRGSRASSHRRCT